MRRRRRTAAALVVAGVACLLSSVLGLALVAAPAGAGVEAGSDFGSFGLAAEANGIKVLGPDPNVVGYVSHALATFRSGPVGYGLASVAWPGPIGGNLGTVLQLFGNPACSPPDDRIPPPPDCPPLPDQVTLLNYPIRAESRTGSGEVLMDDVPGVTMSANVTDDKAVADAVLGRAEAEELGVGAARSTSSTTLTGPRSAVAEATTHVTDISLADGTVTIRSVTSKARASTDAIRAQASGVTTVTGATIGGVPVTIDRDGVRIQDGAAPTAEAIGGVNEALANFGMKIAVSEPIVTRSSAAAVSYSAGSVVFSWIAPPSEEQKKNGEPGQHLITVTLGGATVSAAADPASPFDLGDITPPNIDTGPPPNTSVGGAPPVGQPAQLEEPAVIETNAPGGLRLSDGVAVGWLALAVIGGTLIGVGAHRLPDALLAETGTMCTLEEGP
jgi:hypothetical protein